MNTYRFRWIAAAAALMLVLVGRSTFAQDAPICGTDSGQGCAPASALIDLDAPTFSNPTNITNPLFPISNLHRVLLMGTVDGLPFRTETTLLAGTNVIEWNGQQIETLTSQYLAFLDGRIEEVALDWYAQADDGSVWYLGEDVFNYADGIVADRDGTWLAGQDSPAAMIMPGNPHIGDVYRPENSPGIVYEEVTVTAVNETVYGPVGLVEGAITVNELHMDGGHEDKIFAPGYGEFMTGTGGTLEAAALAIPTDVLGTDVSPALVSIFDSAHAIFAAGEGGDWAAAAANAGAIMAAWDGYQLSAVPPMLDANMSWALVELMAAVNARQPMESRQAAINVARASLDLQLQYRPIAEVDVLLFDLWAAQISVDVEASDTDAIRGDVTTLEWMWQRLAHHVADGTSIETQLAALRIAADAGNLVAVNEAAGLLRAALVDG